MALDTSASSPYIGSSRPYEDGAFTAVLVLESVHEFKKQGKSRTCFWFRDTSGRKIVWFSSRPQTWKIGEELIAEFVVQSHKVFEGEAENVVKKFRVLQAAQVRLKTFERMQESSAQALDAVEDDDSLSARFRRWWNRLG